MLCSAVGLDRLLVLRGGPGRTHASPTGRRSRRAGRAFSCGTQAVGGFPFRIEVRCTGRSVEFKDTQPPIAIKLKDILVVSQVWDPKLLIAEFTGPLTAPIRASRPIDRDLDAGAGERARHAGNARPRLDRGRQPEARRHAPGTPLFDSKHAEFHARVQYGSWPHNPAIDLAVKLNAATRRRLSPYTRDPLDADISRCCTA